MVNELRIRSTKNGKRFRVLNVVDDYTREMIGQLVTFSISGRQVSTLP